MPAEIIHKINLGHGNITQCEKSFNWYNGEWDALFTVFIKQVTCDKCLAIENKYMVSQLESELERNKRNKAQIKARARRSFIIWAKSKISTIGKEIGYIALKIPQNVIKYIYKLWRHE